MVGADAPTYPGIFSPSPFKGEGWGEGEVSPYGSSPQRGDATGTRGGRTSASGISKVKFRDCKLKLRDFPIVR